MPPDFIKFDKFPSNIRRFHTPNYTIVVSILYNTTNRMKGKSGQKPATKTDVRRAFGEIVKKYDTLAHTLIATMSKSLDRVIHRIEDILMVYKNLKKRMNGLEKELIETQLHQEELEERLELLEQYLKHKEHLN